MLMQCPLCEVKVPLFEYKVTIPTESISIDHSQYREILAEQVISFYSPALVHHIQAHSAISN